MICALQDVLRVGFFQKSICKLYFHVDLEQNSPIPSYVFLLTDLV